MLLPAWTTVLDHVDQRVRPPGFLVREDVYAEPATTMGRVQNYDCIASSDCASVEKPGDLSTERLVRRFRLVASACC